MPLGDVDTFLEEEFEPSGKMTRRIVSLESPSGALEMRIVFDISKNAWDLRIRDPRGIIRLPFGTCIFKHIGHSCARLVEAIANSYVD